MMERMAQWLGMPALASENGAQVDELIVLVHWLMLILFVGWLIYFGYVVWRFQSKRNPKADYEGVKGHASNYIELGVVLVILSPQADVQIVALAVAPAITFQVVAEIQEGQAGRDRALPLLLRVCSVA